MSFPPQLKRIQRENMSSSTSFKVTFLGIENDVEVRRFLVSKEAHGNFQHLGGKLLSVFPILGSQKFSVFWKDNEGDDITITSDEDLLIALGEMDGPLYKLNVRMRKETLMDEPVPNLESPVEDFQQWSGVFNDNAGQTNENQRQDSPVMPPMIMTILQYLGINLNGFYCFSQNQATHGDSTNQCPFATPTYHSRNCFCRQPNIIKYLAAQFLRISAMFTRASITVSSVMIMLFIMMILPSFIIHSVLYMALAASLGLPLPTLLSGHLLFTLISCSPTFLVGTAAIWAFHRVFVQKKPLVDVDLEFWKTKFEMLSTHLQQQQQT